MCRGGTEQCAAAPTVPATGDTSKVAKHPALSVSGARSLVRVLGCSRTFVLPQCSFNARPRRNTNTLQIHHTIHARCVGSDAHDLLRSTVSLGLGLGFGFGLGFGLEERVRVRRVASMVLLMRARPRRNKHQHARCVGSDAHDLLRSTVSLGSGLGLGLGLGC